MSIVTYRLEVTMEGEDAPSMVVVDQRDFAAYEGSELFVDELDRFHTRVRFWAWHAMYRTKLTKLKFKEWSQQCIQVYVESSTDYENGEGKQTGDPQ